MPQNIMQRSANNQLCAGLTRPTNVVGGLSLRMSPYSLYRNERRSCLNSFR